jgi:hypothetical protein
VEVDAGGRFRVDPTEKAMQPRVTESARQALEPTAEGFVARRPVDDEFYRHA